MDMPDRVRRLLWRPPLAAPSTRQAVLDEAQRQQDAEHQAAVRRILRAAAERDR